MGCRVHSQGHSVLVKEACCLSARQSMENLRAKSTDVTNARPKKHQYDEKAHGLVHPLARFYFYLITLAIQDTAGDSHRATPLI